MGFGGASLFFAIFGCRQKGLKNKKIRLFGAGGDTGDVAFFDAFGAEGVADKGIFFFVDKGIEFFPEGFESIFGEVAFEDGIFDAHAEVFTGFSDVAEAFGIGDVVGNEVQHVLDLLFGGI